VTTVPRFPVVALVCSAGGLDALTQVLAALPADFPGGIVVLQHQMPETRPSLLASLLDARTDLEVAVATDGALLAPGRALVAPPGQHALVHRDETVVLIPAGPVPPARPSADLLLTTLAVAAGPRCVAVVLSGSGRDGATGATAVHRFGGTVVASDEASSVHFGMPQETITRDHVIDHVLPLRDIGPFLVALTTAQVL
jgi:two-component system, chemotaxis family, protein-glutamate methylesterase/glutaminase